MYHHNSGRMRRLGAVVLAGLLAASGGSAYADLCFDPCCVGNWLVIFSALRLFQPPERVLNACTEANQVTLSFAPSVTSVAPQESFQVRILADLQGDIVAYGFHLQYDESILHLDALDPAPGFRVLNANRPGLLAALAFPDPASGDNLLLGTARFTALAAGGAQISAAVAADDPLEGFANRLCGFADWSAQPTFVPVVPPEARPSPPPPPPIPEPAALLTLLTGLLFARRR